MHRVKNLHHDSAVRATLLDMNHASARATAWRTIAQLDRMIGAARVATVVEPGAAFLLAFEQGDDYDGVHFQWFRERCGTFLYIDRVVVAGSHRRRGLGRLLYEDLFTRATELGHERITCEGNARPPNPISDAFHAALGFAEIGRAPLNDGAKTVRYLVRSQAPSPARATSAVRYA